MDLESSGVVRFDLGPLLLGQTRIAKLKMLKTCLLLVIQVWDGEPSGQRLRKIDIYSWP